MATVNATAQSLSITRASFVQQRSCPIAPSSVLGLPVMAKKGRVMCSMKGNTSMENKKDMNVAGMSASLMAAIMGMSSQAMALVDERMSTEGTGLPFGLSNNLLGWILFGVFGLIWSLYFVYVSGLEEDEDSGLSL